MHDCLTPLLCGIVLVIFSPQCSRRSRLCAQEKQMHSPYSHYNGDNTPLGVRKFIYSIKISSVSIRIYHLRLISGEMSDHFAIEMENNSKCIGKISKQQYLVLCRFVKAIYSENKVKSSLMNDKMCENFKCKCIKVKCNNKIKLCRQWI